MQLLYDRTELEKFHKLLKPLEGDEVYFVSMSARNKYLSAEERASFDLGRSEMMGRKLVKSNDFEHYYRTLRSYEHTWYGRSGYELPSKCLICYANINNCSSKVALKEFYSRTNELLFNLGNDINAEENLRGMDTILMNCYQRARSSRKWIDVDIDTPDREFSTDIVLRLLDELHSKNVETHVISTHSGYHVMLNRATLKFNYNVIIEDLQQEVLNRFSFSAEVVRNVNDMIPIPGTLQGGYEVRFAFEEGSY